MYTYEDLICFKNKISRKYLGEYGIHGVGVQTSKNSICLHVINEFKIINSGIIEQIKKENKNVNIIIKECGRVSVKKE